MGRLKLDQDTLGLSSLMERLTRVRVKDCFQDSETVYFVVNVGELGKAIGKGGVNIKRVSSELNKKIRVIEYRGDVIGFVKNIIYPVTVDEIVEDEKGVVIKDGNRSKKSMLIGRDEKNLKLINRAVQRFFGKEVRVE